MNDLWLEFAKGFIAVLAPIVAGLVVALLVKWLKKVGLDLDAEKQAKAEYWVRQGILSAEEWAASRLKQGLADTPDAESAVKLQHAIDVAVENTDLNVVQAETLVHAQLPQVKLGATAPDFTVAVQGTPA